MHWLGQLVNFKGWRIQVIKNLKHFVVGLFSSMLIAMAWSPYQACFLLSFSGLDFSPWLLLKLSTERFSGLAPRSSEGPSCTFGLLGITGAMARASPAKMGSETWPTKKTEVQYIIIVSILPSRDNMTIVKIIYVKEMLLTSEGEKPFPDNQTNASWHTRLPNRTWGSLDNTWEHSLIFDLVSCHGRSDLRRRGHEKLNKVTR